MGAVQWLEVDPDEEGLRMEQWFLRRFPTLPRSHINKLLRTGQVRLDSKRVKPASKIAPGQIVRVPPIGLQPADPSRPLSRDDATLAELRAMILYEDEDLFVLNKPYGLPVQGGSGLGGKHLDAMLPALQGKSAHKPRLVHRLDRETSGVLLIARRRMVAAELTRLFRLRETQKTYWALVHGVPKPRQGKLSDYLIKDEREGGERMRIARHGEPGSQAALTHFAVFEACGKQLSWVSLKPVTGRTHQLRVQTEALGHPIVGDSKYGEPGLFALPSGMQNKLHLLAKRLVFQAPSGKMIDVEASLPPHMYQSWRMLGLEEPKCYSSAKRS